MESLLQSSELQAHLVLALAGLSSAYIALARPTLTHRRNAANTKHKAASNGSAPGSGSDSSHGSPPATLFEAGCSPALSSTTLAAMRAVLAIYIFTLGGLQLSKLGGFVFKFYTIWNWWLLGLYFALAAVASALCARAEKAAAAATTVGTRASTVADGSAQQRGPEGATSTGDRKQEQQQQPAAAWLHRATPLSRACHALFMVNSSTVVIVDVVCWAVLYPMLSRGPQTEEVTRIIRRLLLSFTSYNQHGLNALFIFCDLLANRQRLAFHAVGPLGLWSLAYSGWAHAWHAMSGNWLYPFLDTSKPWAPVAYLGLYAVHWLAFGLVALLYRVKGALYDRFGVSYGAPEVQESSQEEVYGVVRAKKD
ncbi:hypothetical protein Agub_g6972 [Astrephomene gubernaculifera]|uniref:Uncharacterized protein n=1 Tax=Astrephomene gubernaculifera TaxID=47775 RepID=A0AAD3DRY5_9CHLO|nr:hypothetical protein Agub_g6972 [Astrephomene gubernaculifera]